MIFVLALLALILVYGIYAYNDFVKLRNQSKEAWSDIDVQLKRRYNLIPNIVETVKGYAAHEEGTLMKVTEARAKAINASSMQDHAEAENMLNNALKSLFAVAESYPELKANENFMQLQNELVDTEDKIQAARRFYNGVVRDFNTKVEQFPSKVVAEIFKFTALEFFELDNEEERQNVKVNFDKTPKAPEAQKAPEAPKTPEAPQASLPLEEKK